MTGQAMGEEVTCCPPPHCKHMGFSHRLDLGVAQTPLCFLQCCGFHPSCLLHPASPDFAKKTFSHRRAPSTQPEVLLS